MLNVRVFANFTCLQLKIVCVLEIREQLYENFNIFKKNMNHWKTILEHKYYNGPFMGVLWKWSFQFKKVMHYFEFMNNKYKLWDTHYFNIKKGLNNQENSKKLYFRINSNWCVMIIIIIIKV